MGHDHGHVDLRAGARHAGRLWWSFGLVTGFLVVQVVVGLAAVVQLDAMRRCLQGWWGGPGLGPTGQLRAMVAWSGWPGEVVALLAAVALAAGAWLVVEVARDLRPVGSDAA